MTASGPFFLAARPLKARPVKFPTGAVFFETRSLVAGCYRGALAELRASLSHLMWLDATGGELVFACGGPRADHVCDIFGHTPEQLRARPTCTACAAKWDRFTPEQHAASRVQTSTHFEAPAADVGAPRDPFEVAELYAEADAEEFTATTPEEAIQDVFERSGLSCPIEELLDAHAPMTIEAWDADTVPKDWIERQAVVLAEGFCEAFDDEFRIHDPSSTASAEELFRAAIESALESMHVQRCTKRGERVYERAELETIVRAGFPDWFEEEPEGETGGDA